MQYTSLGKTGTRVSKICLGTMSFGNTSEWMVEKDKAMEIMKLALDQGINFFDTANVYSNGRSEEIVGEFLKDYRDQIVIATKVFHEVGNGPNDYGLSRLHILREVKKSLERLRTDHIDLYQIHRWDNETPIEETLRALDSLVQTGSVRYVGGSSMYAWQFAKALFTSDKLGISRFVTMQNHYNLCYREEEREMNSLCKDQEVGLIPWSPLGRGFLSGKYKRGEVPNSPRIRGDKLLKPRFFKPEDFDVVERAEEIAKEKGINLPQIALAWLLHKGVTAPIVGVTKIEHVEDAVASVEVKLSSDDMRRLEEPYKLHPILGHS